MSRKISWLVKKALWSFYIAVLLVVGGFSFYHLVYAKAVIPGVRIKNANLGGLKFPGAVAAIKGQIPENLDLKLIHNGASFDLKARDIRLNYDIVQTAKNAFKVGREKGFGDLKTKVRGLFGNLDIEYAFSYSEDRLDARLAEIAEKVETPHKDARFSVGRGGELIILPEEIGIVVDKKFLKSKILEKISNADFSDMVVETDDYRPELTQKDLESVREDADVLINNLPMFVFGDKSWRVTKNDFLQMVVFRKEGTVVRIGVDKEKVRKFVISIAEQVNRPPKSEIFKVEGEKVADFRLPASGYVVKEHSAVEMFSLALVDASMERQVTLPVDGFLPSASKNSYGIKELIGEGESTFFGSSKGRVFNIGLAAKNLNGILLAPGEVFSFNSNVGPIDSAHGFTSAYIISKGRTVLGEGGGVCQVSTTLFRAVLNSGLPIIARTAHAYRVGYYEQDKPVGFDATIYQPTVDLKFKNDMQNYVLIQSEYVPKESKLYFRLYGTYDGRKVSTLESKILSQTPPPAPLYQDDPSLPKGVTKQVDWPAWGAVVELKRIVERDGKVLYNDTFISNYQPWRAVYLAGTAE